MSLTVTELVKAGRIAEAHEMAIGRLRSEGVLLSEMVQRSVVGTRMRHRFESLFRREIQCGACVTDAARLDSMSSDDIKANAGSLAATIVRRVAKTPGIPFWARATVAVAPWLARQAVRHWLVSDANDISPVKAMVVRSARSGGCSGCSKPFKPPTVKAVSSTQNRLYQSMLACPPPKSDAFIGTPILHVGVHLWPICDVWKTHVARLNELAGLVNGQCFIGIVTDSTTGPIDAVIAALDPKWQVNVLPNTPDGENPTFRWLQTVVPKGPDDVLIYCHGKGVRPHTRMSEPVRIWTELMYETVIFNHDGIREKLSQGFKTFGAFRTFGPLPLQPRFKWHYSGTFFAVRAKHLSKAPVRKGYGGVEAWPGDMCRPEEGWCEFADNRPMAAQYDSSIIYPPTVNAGLEWEVSRTPGPRMEQHLREIIWFRDKLRSDDRVLVIGSKHGGVERFIDGLVQDIVSIDVAPQPDTAAKRVLTGSSQDPAIQQNVRQMFPVWDVVFIDGDHSLDGVTKDFEFALTLNPRIIAFHDIAEAVKHREEGCQVDQLWTQLKTRYKTDEKIVGGGWGGVGLLWL